MSAYSNGVVQCAQCRIHDIDVLTIDHIHNNGAVERRTLKKYGGIDFYRHLRKNGYPDGYQVLCMNCNLKKEVKNRRTLWKERYKQMPGAKGMMG